MKRAWFCLLYYLSWFAFGAVGLGLNVYCSCLLLLPGRERRAAGVRRGIRWLFELWVKWLCASRVVQVRWVGFPRELPAGTVYVANHPCLIDATFLLARLPDAFCIFKPALLRNPALGPAAFMARYVAGDNAVDLVRNASERVLAGQSLLVFPEGTRTKPGALLNPLRPGFAAIAQRAKAPVQLILIRASAGLVPKGRRWWLPPTVLPGCVELTLDRRWESDYFNDTAECVEVVEKRIREVLSKP